MQGFSRKGRRWLTSRPLFLYVVEQSVRIVARGNSGAVNSDWRTRREARMNDGLLKDGIAAHGFGRASLDCICDGRVSIEES